MAIRDSNGNVYKLKGPNPLMKDQDRWEKFTTHNLKFESETQKNITIPVNPAKTDFKIKSTKIEEKLDKIPIIQSTVPEITNDIKEDEEDLNKTKMYCLPYIVKKNIDKLYEENRPTALYGKKFILEAVIIQDLDFTMTFWANIDFIEPGSIIYPINKSKRWWKIQKKEPKYNGWIYSNVPSDIHPDFT